MEKRSLLHKLKMIFPPKERRYFIRLFFLTLIQTVLDFFGVSLILPLVNLILRSDRDTSRWSLLIQRLLPRLDRTQQLLLLIGGIIIVYVLKNAFSIYMSLVQKIFLSRNQIATSAKLLNCYMRKPYTFHLQHNSAEIIRSINTDVTTSYNIVSSLMSLLTTGMLTLFLVVYLVLVDPGLTLAIVAGLGVYSVLYFLLVRKKLTAAGKESRRLRIRMLKAVQQSVGGIKEVKVMGREQFFVDAYSENGEAFVRNQKQHTILTGIPKRLIEVLCVSGVLGLVAVKVATHQDPNTVVASLSAFAIAAIRLMPNANAINTTINSLSFMMPSLDAVCELIDENFHGDVASALLTAGPARTQKTGPNRTITLDHVSFTYPDTDEPVLRDVCLSVAPGTSIGIVGATGAGKTTLVDIILGLLTPDSGCVRFGETDIREDYASWQAHIGYIPQNIYLIDDTIRANVALGIAADRIEDAGVWRALEDAHLAEFVRSLKLGVDTVIGERGVRISGGQRQRIGIARALYEDPDILFLDEATSSLDYATEEAVMQSVKAIGRGKTCIIIAHRLSTIEHCDQIYEVANGTLVRRK